MVKDNKLEKGLAYWTDFTPVENVVLQSEELLCWELDFSPENVRYVWSAADRCTTKQHEVNIWV